MLMKYSWRISSYCLLQSCKMQVSHFLSLSLDAASSEMGFGGDILLRFSLILLRCTISWSFLLISRPLTFGRSISALQLFWQPFLCLIANGMQFFLAVFLFFLYKRYPGAMHFIWDHVPFVSLSLNGGWTWSDSFPRPWCTHHGKWYGCGL